MFDVELFHFVVGDFDFLLIDALVKSRCDFQSCLSGCAANQAEHQVKTAQRSPGPVATDRTKQTMIRRVPFRSAARIVADRDRQSGFVRQSLQFSFPQAGRYPLLPPLSASMNRCVWFGYCFRAKRSHQFRIDRTANSDVSELVPTQMWPRLSVMS